MGKKQKNCDPHDPDDDHCGDYWDFVAYDPEHRLVLIVIPGARSAEQAAGNAAAADLAPLDEQTHAAVRRVYDELVAPHVSGRW